MLHAVIMAGGSGTRFWPMSRRSRPKQFLPLTDGEETLLVATVERLAPLVVGEQLWVVTNQQHVDQVRSSVPQIPASQVLGEPVGRDTAACVAWACAEIAAVDPDAVCLLLPADHVIGDSGALQRALAAGATHVRDHGGLLTFGIRPTRPETGFGYLKVGAEVRCDDDEHRIHRLDAFVEKPDEPTAQRYLQAGGYLWNSGMFAWRASDLLAEVDRQIPLLGEKVRALVAGRSSDHSLLAQIYPTLPRTSVDFGIMEGAASRWTVPVSFEWSDVGSWPALLEVLHGNELGTVQQGDVVELGCKSSVLVGDGVTVTAVEVADLVVVASGNAVLVAPVAAAQRVKELVSRLQQAGRDDLL